ncbi:hypothetical protein, partial [Actinocorallia lasiicapitis]
DAARALRTRGAAGVILLQSQDESGAAVVEAAAAEAERLHGAGALGARDYLLVRRFRTQRMLVEGDVDGLEAELALALELDVQDVAGGHAEILARVVFARDGEEAGAALLERAITLYVAAGQPWRAVQPCGYLAMTALEAGDPVAAESHAVRALEYGRGTIGAEEAAHLASARVEALMRQRDREEDLITAALDASALWADLHEPDTLHHTFIAARTYQALGRHGEALALYEQVADRIEIPYEGVSLAMTRRNYGEALRENRAYAEAAEQFLLAAALVQDVPDATHLHAELAWSAADMLDYTGSPGVTEAYDKAAALWSSLGQLTPEIRCRRAAAWSRHSSSADDDPGVQAMRGVLADLDHLPSDKEVDELRAETSAQLDQMLR